MQVSVVALAPLFAMSSTVHAQYASSPFNVMEVFVTVVRDAITPP